MACVYSTPRSGHPSAPLFQLVDVASTTWTAEGSAPGRWAASARTGSRSSGGTMLLSGDADADGGMVISGGRVALAGGAVAPAPALQAATSSARAVASATRDGP